MTGRPSLRILIHRRSVFAVQGEHGKATEAKYGVKLHLAWKNPAANGMMFVQIGGQSPEGIVGAATDVLSLCSKTRKLTSDELTELIDSNKGVCPRGTRRLASVCGSGHALCVWCTEAADPDHESAVAAFRERAHGIISFTVPNHLLWSMSDSEQLEILQLQIPNEVCFQIEAKNESHNHVVAILFTKSVALVLASFTLIRELLERASTLSAISFGMDVKYSLRALIPRWTALAAKGKHGKKIKANYGVEFVPDWNTNDMFFLQINGSQMINIAAAATAFLVNDTLIKKNRFTDDQKERFNTSFQSITKIVLAIFEIEVPGSPDLTTDDDAKSPRKHSLELNDNEELTRQSKALRLHLDTHDAS
jgi:hypothetical protein